MLKVVFIGHRDMYFGAESVLFRILLLLREKNIAVPLVVVPRSKDDGFSSKCKEENIEVKHAAYKLIGANYFRAILCLGYNAVGLVKLIIHLRKEQVDTIYTNTSVNIIGPLLALMLNKKHIWHFHEQPTNGNFRWIPKGLFGLYRFLIRREGTTIVFVSNAQKALWEQAFHIKIPNHKVIYSPPEEMHEVKTFKGDELKADKALVTFGFLGSFTHSKNIPGLLAAFAKLRSNYSVLNVKLLLMGAGEMEPAINKEINRLGLESEVKILAHSTVISPFFSEVNIFVLPSYFESWGLVALEAIQHRKPLIVTCNSALSEILKNEVDCLFIEPSVESSLYIAMERLLFDPDYRDKMANHAYCTLKSLDLNAKFESSIISLFKEGVVQ
jgi:glycosyltransferase involved in cell wall biosynthesis